MLDFKQAFDFQSKYAKMTDSLQRVASRNEAARLHYNYELDKKEAAIASVQQQRDREVFRRNLKP